MIIEIIANIIVIGACIGSIYFFINCVKKAETIYEKILLILLLFVYLIPVIIYLLDVYDIPTRLGYAKKVDSIRWFDFISNYSSTISGSVISGGVLLMITIWQMKKQKDENNDNKRIQNAPTMKYSLINKDVDNKLEFFLENNDAEQMYNLFINVENIGLNHAKHLKLEILSSFIKDDKIFSINNEQSLLKKDENININIIFYFNYDNINENNNIQNIEIIFYYDDLLNNHYKQDINLQARFTDKYSDKLKSKEIEVISIIIKDEELLNKKDN